MNKDEIKRQLIDEYLNKAEYKDCIETNKISKIGQCKKENWDRVPHELGDSDPVYGGVVDEFVQEELSSLTEVLIEHNCNDEELLIKDKFHPVQLISQLVEDYDSLLISCEVRDMFNGKHDWDIFIKVFDHFYIVTKNFPELKNRFLVFKSDCFFWNYVVPDNTVVDENKYLFVEIHKKKNSNKKVIYLKAYNEIKLRPLSEKTEKKCVKIFKIEKVDEKKNM